MTHYICRGTCKGESEEPGQCGADDCNKYEEQLEPCDCEDNEHKKSEAACGSCSCGH